MPAELTLKEEQDIAEVQKVKAYMTKLVGDKWLAEAEKATMPIINTAVKTKAVTDTARYKVIGDFRGSGLDGWKSDGYAFGNRTTLGKPVFNQKNELTGLSDGKASSRSVATGVFGALRSPNFIIKKDFIGVRWLMVKALRSG
ncbi:MAG: hypothetical protein WDN75_08650 [Bacteroidota bacterium]